MPTNWSQQQYDCMPLAEREAEQYLRVCPESLVPEPTHRIEHPPTRRAEAEPIPAARDAQWKMWSFGWGRMLAALAGVMLFIIFHVASISVVGSALTVAGIVATVGLGNYLLLGRVFARGEVRERQHLQERDDRSEASEPEPPDGFPLGLNARERRERLPPLQHSLSAAREGREESGESGDSPRIAGKGPHVRSLTSV
jgi:hypothetical protein